MMDVPDNSNFSAVDVDHSTFIDSAMEKRCISGLHISTQYRKLHAVQKGREFKDPTVKIMIRQTLKEKKNLSKGSG